MTAAAVALAVLSALVAVCAMLIARNTYRRARRMLRAVGITPERWDSRNPCGELVKQRGAYRALCTFPRWHRGPHGLTEDQIDLTELVQPPF
jgi:hypothetical protein